MSNWSFEELWAAWLKTKLTLSDEYRIDCDGRTIRWSEYGRNTSFGWHVDHIIAVALGGSDHPTNLRARHHSGNCSAGGALGNAMRVNRMFGGLDNLPPPTSNNAMMGGIGALRPINAMAAFRDGYYCKK